MGGKSGGEVFRGEKEDGREKGVWCVEIAFSLLLSPDMVNYSSLWCYVLWYRYTRILLILFQVKVLNVKND